MSTDAIELVRAWIRDATLGGRKVRPAGLIRRASEKLQLPMLDVRTSLAQLVHEGLLSGVSSSGEPLGMVQWLGESLGALSSDAVRLDQELQKRGIRAPASALERTAECFRGLHGQDVDHLIEGLFRLRQLPLASDPIFGSAQHLLGSAKALGHLRVVAKLLDIQLDDTASEFFVLTAGPAEPQGVVLIENIRSFSAFARSSHARRMGGIASFGYGLTMESFATRLQAGQVIAAPAFGAAFDVASAVSRGPCVYWGDLDLEGLRIFESLKARLPGLQLSAAYAAMEALLAVDGAHHPYHMLFEKSGQRRPRCEIPEVRRLAEACAIRCVDQERLGFLIDDLDLLSPYRVIGPV